MRSGMTKAERKVIAALLGGARSAKKARSSRRNGRLSGKAKK